MLRPVATRALPLLLIACALAAGCGDSGPSDEQRIRETLTDFERAAGAGDHATLCDRVLAARLIDTLEQIGLPCETALAKALEGLREPQISVGTVSVDGDRATAQVRSSAAGQAPSEDTVDLVRVADGWRIASLGGDAAP
jgi:hypothetical protein